MTIRLTIKVGQLIRNEHNAFRTHKNKTECTGAYFTSESLESTHFWENLWSYSLSIFCENKSLMKHVWDLLLQLLQEFLRNSHFFIIYIMRYFREYFVCVKFLFVNSVFVYHDTTPTQVFLYSIRNHNRSHSSVAQSQFFVCFF